ncbi:MAG: DUF4381 domain-containing protein [Pseudomonadales bacterium]
MNQPATPRNPDPLADLRDIHLPPPVEAWPPAPGWWIVGFLLLAATVALIVWWLRYWRANRYRREALRELDRLFQVYQANQDARAWLHDFEALLKRVALTRYAREDVASLTGVAWVAFLDKTAGIDDFSMGPGQALIDDIYKPANDNGTAIDVRQLHELGKQWIKHHGNPEAA